MPVLRRYSDILHIVFDEIDLGRNLLLSKSALATEKSIPPEKALLLSQVRGPVAGNDAEKGTSSLSESLISAEAKQGIPYQPLAGVQGHVNG